jgi:predicted membrane protein
VLYIGWENVLAWSLTIIYVFVGLYLFHKKIKKDLKEDEKNIDEYGYVIEPWRVKKFRATAAKQKDNKNNEKVS